MASIQTGLKKYKFPALRITVTTVLETTPELETEDECIYDSSLHPHDALDAGDEQKHTQPLSLGSSQSRGRGRGNR